MFSSLFASAPEVDPTAPNFFPATANVPESELWGKLEPTDTEWLCPGGFAVETQTFYTITDEGKNLMCQVIHSSTGLWYPTVQFTFKLADPKTGERYWKSTNVNHFTSPPPNLDKRSCKADEFTLTYKGNGTDEFPEYYVLNANLGAELQVAMEFKRHGTVAGWKLGKGPKSAHSFFGPDQASPEGYVVHRFWPRTFNSGHLIFNGKAEAVQGAGMFVHAIQGMRPNLVASTWNFQHFQSSALGGVSAIQMEFTTCDTHGLRGANSGRVTVNIGSLVVDNKLVAITAQTSVAGWADKKEGDLVSRVAHLDSELDPETGYVKPTRVVTEWKGPSVLPEAPGTLSAHLESNVGTLESPNGLIDKVDVLAEIPYVIKVAVNYVAGTKPYIYQWQNPATMKLVGPDTIAPGLSAGIEIDGISYVESSFIS